MVGRNGVFVEFVGVGYELEVGYWLLEDGFWDWGWGRVRIGCWDEGFGDEGGDEGLFCVGGIEEMGVLEGVLVVGWD